MRILRNNPPQAPPYAHDIHECRPEQTPSADIREVFGIMALVQSGDEVALAKLYDAHSRLVYAVALKILRNPADAEDVLQDVFLRIWRNPTGYLCTAGSIPTWLAAVSRNRSIDILRVRRPTDRVDSVALYALDDVSEEVERTLMIHRVKDLIENLPAAQRVTIRMAFVQGLTHAQIAEMLEAPLGTVKTHVRAALRTLKAALTNQV